MVYFVFLKEVLSINNDDESVTTKITSSLRNEEDGLAEINWHNFSEDTGLYKDWHASPCPPSVSSNLGEFHHKPQ